MVAFAEIGVPIHCPAAWIIDAPFRETEAAIASRMTLGLTASEM